ncbi:MAG: hypothetical protein P4L55_12160 [Syntrophobacteraceae bacterium]|nr:hypothetical protein [Syntrophobacteraceae bacterium]
MKKRIVLIAALIIVLAFVGAGQVMALIDQLTKQDKKFLQGASATC